MKINDIATEYKRLSSQLLNPGEEISIAEVTYNDGIFEAQEKLLNGVDPDYARLIRLNLL